jgi:TDG/mug DNA glycosylase family protein
MPSPWKPTRQELAAAYGRPVRDLIAPKLRILFCGINPGLYSAAVGHHFARPGNRFWPTLHLAGFCDRLLSPFDERALLGLGYGITNIVARATASADELTRDELIAGASRLLRKVRRYQPTVVAFLGLTAYCIAFDRPSAGLGFQKGRMAGSHLCLLPNPSGLNAHYQLADLARLFKKLRTTVAHLG